MERQKLVSIVSVPRRRVVVVMPCLNESATIGAVLASVPTQLDGIGDVTRLVIDDGSTDDSRAVAEAAGAVVISHGYNRGVGAAFQTALAYAVSQGFDYMVSIDADGQFDSADIPRLLAPLVSGEAEFVTASRFSDKAYYPDMPPVKFWGNHRMAELISRLSRNKFYDVSCGFRAYSREAMLRLNLHGVFTYTQETFLDLTSKGLRIKEVPVHVRYFKERKSRVANNLWKYAWRTSSIIFRLYRDYYPLRFFWSIGLGFVGLGAMFGAWLLIHYWRTGMFTGQIWAGFVGASLGFVGLVSFAVGVVADMLDRVRVNQERILYMLKSKDNRPPQ